MAIFSFSKLPRHKQFSYQPRYFDPEKEKIEQKKRISIREGSKSQAKISPIAGQFRNLRVVKRTRSSAVSRWSRLALLALMFFPIYLYYIEMINGIFAILAVFFLLVIFIYRTNKA